MATRNENSAPVLRSFPERAHQAGVHPQTIEAEVREGRIRETRVRRRRMIHDDDFDDWLNRCRGFHGRAGEGTTDVS